MAGMKDKIDKKRERLRKRETRRSRLSLGHPAWVVFAFAALASVIFVGIDARGVLAAGDEWDYFHRLATQPLHEALFDAPPDKYLLAVPLFSIYLPQAEIFGIGETLPLRLAGMGLVVVAAGLTMELVRRRAGFGFALPAAILLLFLGAAGEVAATPQRIPGVMAVCFGVGMLLALDRQDRRGDLTASVLGILGIASHPVMIPFLAGAAVRLVLAKRDRIKRLALVLSPAVVAFAAWRLTIYEQLDAAFPQTFSGVIEFAGDHFVALIAALSGVFRGPFTSGTDFITGLSVAIAILAGIALVFVIVRHRGLTAGLAAALAMLVVALIAPAIGPSGALRTPAEGRYIHPGAVIVLIFLAEIVAAGKPWPRHSSLVAAAVFFVWLFSAMPSNLMALHERADDVQVGGDIVRAELGALEAARQEPGSAAEAAAEAEGTQGQISALAFRGNEPGEVPASLVIGGAPAYFDIAEDYGTPANGLDTLAMTRPELQVQADIVLVSSLPVTPVVAEAPPAGLDAGGAEPVTEEDAAIPAGTCASVAEPAEAPVLLPEPPPEETGIPLTSVTVSPGEVWIGGENIAGLRVGRFAPTATRPLQVAPDQDLTVTLPATGAEDLSWRLQIYGDGPVTVCAA